MRMNKNTILAAALVALGLGAASAGVIHAASNSPQTNPMNNLVNAIASKFNLNPSDVQAVFDQQHAQVQAQRQQQQKDYLAQQVAAGKLTQEQADKIIAKMQELEAQHLANMQNMQNLTQEQRRAAMEQERASLQQWAADNNIPAQYLRFGMGMGHHKGFGRMMR